MAPWRADLTRSHFTSLFLITNPQIRLNKDRRFSSYMRKAASGTLFERPDYHAAWKPHIRFGAPMFGVLQSKTDDVKYEINFIRRQFPTSRIVFIGGDGLSIMRMNQIIAREPWTYLNTAPMVIPVAGEAPHGTHHFHHADWRLYWPLIEVCQPSGQQL